MDIWTRFHKMNLHQRINKANLITQFFKTNSSKLHFKSFKISREQSKDRKRNSKTIRDFYNIFPR